MNQKIILLLFTVICFGNTSHGQQIIGGGYLSQNFTHPGLFVHYGTEWKTIAPEGKSSTRHWEASGQVGMYHHRRFQTGVLALGQVEWYLERPKGFQLGIGMNAGYLRAFVPGTWEPTGDGTFDRKPFSGTNHILFGPGIRIGKDLEAKTGLPMDLVLRNQFMTLIPWFENHSNSLLFSIGIHYRLSKKNS